MGDVLTGLATFLIVLLLLLIPAMVLQDFLRMPRRLREMQKTLQRIERRLEALDGAASIDDR